MPDEHKWTHTICCDCWDKKNPDRPTTAETREHDSGVDERCCYCGQHTRTGIYIRDSIDNTICDTFVEEREVREVRTMPPAIHWQQAAYWCNNNMSGFDMLTTPMQGMLVGAYLDLYGTEHEYKAEMFSDYNHTLQEVHKLHSQHGRNGWGYEK